MTARLWAGGAALCALLALGLGSLVAVVWRAEGFAALGPPDWQALRFTLTQAAASALISVALAIPVARALARRQFYGRSALVALLGLPFILPVIVAVMGLISVFGRAGILNTALAALGLPAVSIYGAQGVVLAHVFLNMPLAVRLILNGWAGIPAERFRLAAALGFGPRDIARLIERPMLRTTLPGAVLAIFLICLTSFTVALIMGGGPRATTLELAIYQAFRFEFDLAHAASLASLQMGLSFAVALACLSAFRPAPLGSGLDRRPERWDAGSLALRVLDTLWLSLALLFLALPLMLVLAAGLPWMLDLPASVWPAAARSVAVALTSALISLTLALALALMITALRRRAGLLVDAIAMLMLTASPLVLGTGLFLILRGFADPVAWALPITAIVNAAVALPFCLRAILPALREIEASYSRLADSLDLTGLARLRLLILPRLARPMGFASGLAAALSMGDLGVITLFADPARATLPMQVYAMMSAYRSNQAAAAALVLMALSFALFWVFDQRGRRHASA